MPRQAPRRLCTETLRQPVAPLYSQRCQALPAHQQARPEFGRFGSTFITRDERLLGSHGAELLRVSAYFDRLPVSIKEQSISAKSGRVRLGMLRSLLRHRASPPRGFTQVEFEEFKADLKAINDQIETNQEMRKFSTFLDRTGNTVVASEAIKSQFRAYQLTGQMTGPAGQTFQPLSEAVATAGVVKNEDVPRSGRAR